jgi:hypothetical protein
MEAVANFFSAVHSELTVRLDYATQCKAGE